MAFGLPNIGELDWGQKILDSINAIKGMADSAKGTADAALPASSAKPVATSGEYGDLTGKPTIPSTPGEVGAEPEGLSAATSAALEGTIDGRVWSEAAELDVREFGAWSESTGAAAITANTATLQAAFDHIGANGGTLSFPGGKVVIINDTITVTRAASADWLRFDFKGSRLVWSSTATPGPFFEFNGGGVFGSQTGPTFANLQLAGNNVATQAFVFRDAGRSTFENIIVRNVTGKAFRLENFAGYTENCTFRNITVQTCGGIAEYHGAADLGGVGGTDSFARQVWRNIQGGSLTGDWFVVNAGANLYHSEWSMVKGNVNKDGIAIFDLHNVMPNAIVESLAIENTVGTSYFFDLNGQTAAAAASRGSALPRIGRLGNGISGSSMKVLRGDENLIPPAFAPTAFGPFVDVTDPRFLAVGDGSTDCTTAIQAALDFAAEASAFGTSTVFLPAGAYNVTQLVIPDGVNVIGAGRNASIIYGMGATDTIIDDGGRIAMSSFRDFSVSHANNVTGVGIALWRFSNGVLRCQFSDMDFWGKAAVTDTGLELSAGSGNGCFTNTIKRVLIDGPAQADTTGLYLHGNPIYGENANINHVEMVVSNKWGTAYRVDNGHMNQFISCVMNRDVTTNPPGALSLGGYQKAALHFYNGDATQNLTFDNMLVGFYFDSMPDVDSIILETIYDHNATANVEPGKMLHIVGGRQMSPARVNIVAPAPSDARQTLFTMHGEGVVVATFPSVESWRYGGVYGVNPEGVLPIRASFTDKGGGFLCAGSAATASNAVAPGGASATLDANVTGAAFRVVKTTNGASYTNMFEVGLDGAIKPLFNASATLDFPSIAAQGQQELTIALTGALATDTVMVRVPASLPAGLFIQARVSTAGVVTVRACNFTAAAIDPPSVSYKVMIFR